MTGDEVVIGLDANKCPVCRTMREKSEKISQIAKGLGFNVKSQKYCQFHYKVLKILSMQKYGATRIFKVSANDKTVKIHFGSEKDGKKATILLIIPKENGNRKHLVAVANGRIFNRVSPEVLNLLTPQELDVVIQYLNTTN